MWIFYYFNFERSYEALKSKRPYFLLNKNTNFNKRTRNRKWKIAHTILERQILRFSSQKNHESKVKRWWVGSRKRKEQFVFSTVYFVQSNFLLFYLNVQCIQYIYTLLHITRQYILLIFKIVKCLQFIIKNIFFFLQTSIILYENYFLVVYFK